MFGLGLHATAAHQAWRQAPHARGAAALRWPPALPCSRCQPVTGHTGAGPSHPCCGLLCGPRRPPTAPSFARFLFPPPLPLAAARRLVDQMEALTPAVPSLIHCTSLEVRGPVEFRAGVVVRGKVTVENGETRPPLALPQPLPVVPCLGCSAAAAAAAAVLLGGCWGRGAAGKYALLKHPNLAYQCGNPHHPHSCCSLARAAAGGGGGARGHRPQAGGHRLIGSRLSSHLIVLAESGPWSRF